MPRLSLIGAVSAAALASVALAACTTQMDAGPAVTVSTERTVMVGGAPMFPSRNIVENAVESADHTTLVAAVRAADLVDTLASPGPFTVFAPTNAAFGALPPGAVDSLLKPENKPALTEVLTYHVVPGRLTAADLAARVAAGGGQAMLTTAAGAPLQVTVQGNTVLVRDANGRVSTVTIADVLQSNGVIHVVDTVLLPA